jgi:hypothetical protein
MKSWFTSLFLSTLILFFAGCRSEGDRMAGGGGVDVEGISVEGTAMHADHTPVIAAQVHLRTWDFLRNRAIKKIAVDRADTQTDSLGHFRIKDLDTGRYAIEIDAGSEGATRLEIDADGSQHALKVDAIIQATGSIEGDLREANGNSLFGTVITLLGLDRIILTDSSGAFKILDLPPGTYIIRATPTTDTLSAVEIPEIVVMAGGVTMVGPIILPHSQPTLMAQWKFNEGQGNISANGTGSESRVVLKGSTTWNEGWEGKAIQINNNSFAYVPKSNSSSLDIQDGADFTLTARILVDSLKGLGKTRRIVDSRTNYTPYGFALGLAADGRAEFFFQGLADKVEYRLGGIDLIDAQGWHVLAAGRVGTRYFLYVDGIFQSEAQGPSGALTKENPLYFGCTNESSNFFTGRLDDIRLYRRALTTIELSGI